MVFHFPEDDTANIIGISEIVPKKAYDDWDGFEVKIGNYDPVRVCIEHGQICCESYGLKLELPPELENDSRRLVGARAISIGWGRDRPRPEWDYHEARVELRTSVGDVFLVAYNQQNGYYSHLVKVEWPGYISTESV